MDVKFPLDNYVRYLESTGENEQARYRADFLRDVRNRLKEVASRDYIDAESDTVDYALLFIPNEQIYAFIQEHDSRLIDQGLQQHVIICSPMTLFAVLAVVRQSVENFSLEKTSNEILTLISAFKKQWDEFIKKMDGLGKKIADAQAEFDTLLGVRRRQLELPLGKLDGVRSLRGLPEPEGPKAENSREQEI
ncbi:MAG: DNA recombination protein RmuC [bacterium ADurb.Bin478]|nr:MAG: DNA recombination protein RmuC [bacterium ADurb.Bin478]